MITFIGLFYREAALRAAAEEDRAWSLNLLLGDVDHRADVQSRWPLLAADLTRQGPVTHRR